MRRPRIRTVERVRPPYPLNSFPPDFPFRVAEHIVYWHLTCENSDIRGEEWERIFADAIGGSWTPSNVGLDDVVIANCAWGAKTVKSSHPAEQRRVRLVAGRNSPAYSFDERDLSTDPNVLGGEVLQIWNARVEQLRGKYAHLRNVVLLKAPDMLEFAIFEFETSLYPPDGYRWVRNQRGNLEARDSEGLHRFTWQPHGSQFTIIQSVPPNRLAFRIRAPERLNREEVLNAVGFDRSWVEVLR